MLRARRIRAGAGESNRSDQTEQLGPPVTPSVVPEVSAPAADAEQGKSEDKTPGGPAAEKPEERAASPNQPAMPAPSAATSGSICLLLESAADAHGLPLEFFARLIWQESRFKPNAIGPMTRRGTRAQGIAQFMPGTASERGLLDPFDPVAALPKAAEYLEELHAQFGNLGLAAAAYNAGPRRVRDFLTGRSGLPSETRNYVLKITGISVDEWAALGGAGDKGPVKRTNCNELMAMLTEQPSPFIGELARRVKEGGGRPWGVELTAGFSRAKVLAAYATLERPIGRFWRTAIWSLSRTSSAVAARSLSIRCGSGRTREARLIKFAVRFGRPVEPASCCAI